LRQPRRGIDRLHLSLPMIGRQPGKMLAGRSAPVA
jgi:hypothetical protein